MTGNGANRPLTLDGYQRQALKTAVYPRRGQNLEYPILGLLEEIGEIAGHLKRIQRDDDGELTAERRNALLQELGDALWYVAALSFEMGRPLRQLLGMHNFDPLEKAGLPLAEQYTPFGLIWRMQVYLVQILAYLGDNDARAAAGRVQPMLVLWSALCTTLTSSPESIARLNLQKLADRAERGALHGEGSER